MHQAVGRLAWTTGLAVLCVSGLLAQHGHGSEGVGKAHMETSCSSTVQASFDRALALLHNFWYARALKQFQQIQKSDPECAIAYWGAAMTYNHPFWDAPSRDDEAAAWAYVQRGLKARSQSDRERMYLLAVAALFKDAGAGTKSSRDEAYRDQMAAAYAKYPDDETTLFYGLSILGTIREGAKGFEMQGRAVDLFESVYARNKQHPGVLHYLIHAYDDPVHAEAGLAAARAYAKTAAAVPHAYHMPSHIFTRLGYWDEAAATNENAWRISNDDVKAAGEPGELRDFHSLNYLSYNYLQLGRYRDAKETVDLFAKQYTAITNRKTAPDSQDLQARHVRGRTIFALPDRVLYGYFDTLARFIVESESWSDVHRLPLIAPSSDFVVMKLQLEVMAAAKRKDVAAARTKAAAMMERALAVSIHSCSRFSRSRREKQRLWPRTPPVTRRVRWRRWTQPLRSRIQSTACHSRRTRSFRRTNSMERCCWRWASLPRHAGSSRRHYDARLVGPKRLWVSRAPPTQWVILPQPKWNTRD
jgi:tetratricopeptide (TPR) repeat protein